MQLWLFNFKSFKHVHVYTCDKLLLLCTFIACMYVCMYVYMYVLISTGAPAMITNVIIDLATVNIDDDNVSFTLSWNEPFANFDPIVNYTVTINCTDNATCPVIVDTDNVTRTADVNFITDLSMMTTLSVTATNTINTSDPAIRIITGKLCTSVLYKCTVQVYMYMHVYNLFIDQSQIKHP